MNLSVLPHRQRATSFLDSLLQNLHRRGNRNPPLEVLADFDGEESYLEGLLSDLSPGEGFDLLVGVQASSGHLSGMTKAETDAAWDAVEGAARFADVDGSYTLQPSVFWISDDDDFFGVLFVEVRRRR